MSARSIWDCTAKAPRRAPCPSSNSFMYKWSQGPSFFLGLSDGVSQLEALSPTVVIPTGTLTLI
jgi:hypothetical protein